MNNHTHPSDSEGNSFSTDIKHALCSFKNILRRISQLIAQDGAPQATGDPLDYPKSANVMAPTFYSIKPDSYLAWLEMAWVSFSIAGVFGAIHCTAWSAKFEFSSHGASVL